jgi:YesN/AraC family two-component response regulator
MQYSPLVQKVIAVIDTDLTCELNLHSLAALHNINPSYLSTLFRKETGKTLTEYITTARMDAAAKLLKTTSLQVQTVAQHCGISDVNYFSKLFRRHFGVAPKQFREQNYAFLPKRT